MSSNYLAGHNAEKRAAEYLKSHGYKIIGLNWKTRYCEIDIIAEKSRTAYFVEVKYRKNDRQGRGLDYITPGKLRQMGFAAEMWVNNMDWPGDYVLSAIGIDGENYEFIESLT